MKPHIMTICIPILLCKRHEVITFIVYCSIKTSNLNIGSGRVTGSEIWPMKLEH